MQTLIQINTYQRERKRGGRESAYLNPVPILNSDPLLGTYLSQCAQPCAQSSGQELPMASNLRSTLFPVWPFFWL